MAKTKTKLNFETSSYNLKTRDGLKLVKGKESILSEVYFAREKFL